ncbi:polysaccharide biosynthesis/export family protein [Sinorhizobium sp. B11]|jgi:exopolysaccharide production protein ExoF|uniref:polysaccharide biosynthesis/export family protein n=1 Tax=unclassified Rhizobium TaxID=2613769 RepID=UPI000DD5CD1D|nr:MULTISPECIES: polysaccharide biosynthesis/export family protein [unclassified Rhizobium]MBB3442348.1 exopolysaccharide production protein ExoF [Rhizobium sp. BK379]MBB3559842.1 exopolysaccharide production protein ExoF [Rhizobium sp. BK512]
MRLMSFPDRLTLAGLAAVFTCLLGWTAAHADNYTLVPEDKIKLRVVEWRSTDSKYASWEALDGTYNVDDAGNLSIPIAGQIRASGQTTEQLSETISDALAEKADLPGRPFIAVEIDQHAPIFVNGSIERPGRYPFEANMTVMKAVSIAGGYMRARDESSYYDRDRIQAAGDYRTAVLNRRDLLMRAARLRAEIAGQPDFDIPSEIGGVPDIGKLKAEELNLMRLRAVETNSKVEAADDLSRLYTQEIQSLEAKVVSQKRQIDLAQQELNNVNSLVSKGLTSNTRQFSVDRSLAETQSELLDLEIALTKSRQGLNESQREKADVINKRNAENQQELNTISLAINKAGIDMQVAQLLGDQAGYSAELARMGAESTLLGTTKKNFKIVRRNEDGSYSNIVADENTALLPHDIIEIGVEAAADASSAASQPQQPAGALVPNVARSDAPRPEWVPQTGSN